MEIEGRRVEGRSIEEVGSEGGGLRCKRKGEGQRERSGGTRVV